MKNSIKNILHKDGWNLGRETVMSSKALQTAKSLKSHNINVAGNSVSSSILPMLSSQLDSAPQSNYTHITEAKIITLDSVYSQYCTDKENGFIKIDTQGYEWHVSDGAT